MLCVRVCVCGVPIFLAKALLTTLLTHDFGEEEEEEEALLGSPNILVNLCQLNNCWSARRIFTWDIAAAILIND